MASAADRPNAEPQADGSALTEPDNHQPTPQRWGPIGALSQRDDHDRAFFDRRTQAGRRRRSQNSSAGRQAALLIGRCLLERDLGREEAPSRLAVRDRAGEVDDAEFDLRAAEADGPGAASRAGQHQGVGLAVAQGPLVHEVVDGARSDGVGEVNSRPLRQK